jgi:hypothetical protein
MNVKLNKVKINQFIEEKKPMDLMRLLVAFFANDKKQNRNYDFPSTIGDYKIVREIPKIGSKKDFSISIFKRKDGQKAFTKAWYGNKRDYKYYTLVNEIRAYYLLNQIITRLNNKLPQEFSDVVIPRLLDVYEGKDSLVVFLSFEDGQLASDFESDVKITAYIKIVKYLKFLGNQMSDDERKLFSRRDPISYLLLYPLLLIKSILNFPSKSGILLMAVPAFLKSIFYLLQESESVLAHRDLHFSNILISKKSIVLVDLQYMVFTEIIYEFVTTLRYRWGIDGFEKPFMSKTQKFFEGRMHFFEIFNGLIVNSVTHGLTDKTFTDEKITRWTNLLKVVNTNYLGIRKAYLYLF